MTEKSLEQSLVAQRVVSDSVKSLGDINKVDTIPISNEILKCVEGSNRDHKVALNKWK